MQQKLSKIIKQLNKENAPPDGWKPEDRVLDIYEIRILIQTFLEKVGYKITDACVDLSDPTQDAELIFKDDIGRYSIIITRIKNE